MKLWSRNSLRMTDNYGKSALTVLVIITVYLIVIA